MKKVKRLFLCIISILMCLSVFAAAVHAEEEPGRGSEIPVPADPRIPGDLPERTGDQNNPVTLQLGKMTDVTITDYEDYWFAYTPGTSGYYTFESYGDEDTQVTAYKADDMTYLCSDGSNGEGENFRLSLWMDSGKKYCFGIGWCYI